MSKRLVVIIAFCSFLGSALPARARILHVPREYDSIQEAIDISDRGDTIKVAPGTYYENIVIRDGRHLLGAGADRTILTDDGEGPPDPIIQIEGDCTVSGFTVTGARGAGIGHAIMITRGAPTVKNNVVRDNSYTGIGVHSESSLTNPLITKNKIYGNGGAGIAVLGQFARPIIRDNELHDNTNVGIASTDLGSPLVQNNNIFENGVGVAAKEGAKAVIKGNKIVRNKLVGVAVLKEALGVVRKNEITGNGTVGVNVEEKAEAWLLENQIADNGTEGVSIKSDSKAYLGFNYITANVSVSISVRDSRVIAVRNQLYTSDNPKAVVSRDFLESLGIDVDHDHQVSGFGPGVVELKNSSIAVGGNRLEGKIEVDDYSGITKLAPESIPARPQDVNAPTYETLAPGLDMEEEQEHQAPPVLKVPELPRERSIFFYCMGMF